MDFSRAFDTVKHKPLFEKYYKLDLNTNIYNWLVSYFEGRNHTTKFQGNNSTSLPINASIVQGSGVGPFSYDVAASDLQPKSKKFCMHKYADDTYLVTAGDCQHEIAGELDNVVSWATKNNLSLNKSKTCEIVFFKRGLKRSDLPSPTPGIQRLSSITVLGVTLQSNLMMDDHTGTVLSECASLLYALGTLRAHGMQQPALQEVFRAGVLSKIMYSSPAWWGFATANNCNRINAFLNKCKKRQYYPENAEMFESMCALADDALFEKVAQNPSHVLHKFLPTLKTHDHNLRKRKHNFNLTSKDDKNFISRLILKDTY